MWNETILLKNSGTMKDIVLEENWLSYSILLPFISITFINRDNENN